MQFDTEWGQPIDQLSLAGNKVALVIEFDQKRQKKRGQQKKGRGK
jgi:hypothetical protein